jgi:hypothetical protein
VKLPVLNPSSFKQLVEAAAVFERLAPEGNVTFKEPPVGIVEVVCIVKVRVTVSPTMSELEETETLFKEAGSAVKVTPDETESIW